MSIRELGFTDKHIVRLTRQTDPGIKELYAKRTEVILNRHQEGLSKLMEEVGMEPDNITSMMWSAGNKLDIALQDLTRPTTRMALTKLQSELGFEAKQLSSMLVSGGRHTASMVTALARKESIETMKSFKEKFDVEPKTLSSLLRGQGRWIGDAIDALGSSETEAIFKSFAEIGVKPKNISSMIGTAGGGFDSNLAILVENKPKLTAMIETHSPNAISSKINTAKGNLSVRIDQVYTDLLNEMAGQYSPLEGKEAEASKAVKNSRNTHR